MDEEQSVFKMDLTGSSCCQMSCVWQTSVVCKNGNWQWLGVRSEEYKGKKVQSKGCSVVVYTCFRNTGEELRELLIGVFRVVFL